MWILTTIGFFSIVQKPWDVERGTVTIRARVRGDLENLRDGYLPEISEITESTDSDYRFRAVVPQSRCADALAKIVQDIDYDNFKDEVARLQGRRRAHVYHDVWASLFRLRT